MASGRRGNSRQRGFVGEILHRFVEERFFQIGASLAYTTLLSLVPLVALVVGIVSIFPFFRTVLAQVNRFLVQNLLPEKAGAVIAQYTLTFSQKAQDMTWLGLAFLALTALLLMVSVEKTFNHVWRVNASRPIGERIKLYCIMLLLGPLVLGGIFGAMSYGVTVSLGLFGEPPWLQHTLFKGVSLALLWGFFAFLYYAVPNARVRLGHALVGGLFAAVGISLMQRGFEIYLSNVPSYTLIYGAFAVVPIFLVWLYLCWLVLLLGGLIAATLHRHR